MAKMISNIVFTKNRPLQLEAYLASLYRHLPEELIQTYIVYKADRFGEQYAELFHRFSRCFVIKEQDFYRDFMNLIEQIDTKYILFGTDDVVYYDSVNFAVIDETFSKFTKEIFGFSLKLHPQSLRMENEIIVETVINGENIYYVNWKNAKSRNAKYPFELDSTLYRTTLVREIITHIAAERPVLKKVFQEGSLQVKILSHIISMKNFLASMETFHCPNTLEGYGYRWCKTHKSKMPEFLYFQKLCASAIQVNIVNTSVNNPTDGSSEHTIEALNEKYKQGFRFDIEAIERNRPKATHVGREYFRFVKK